ncbi:ATP-binding cassette, subfamily B [Ruminococcus sp. YE71]|uniref:ABC transporter ATP-binding protein n=1 Tax=unclassified Ruminococcus TaxID=2608920 RepID=UPI000888BF0A|nr:MULTISPECIES: ABC transporter ATP-binding protein [unclassified Ruminococcus]SDA15397.1 ATP-binding cassette, subfamily B [Ruminococcus sp. YE78]SFW22467.1 ATP-binding cassette, subfamily B [Ruminococcus sp. YE71]
MLKLFGYLKKYRLEAVLAPLGKLLEAIFELIVPIVMKRIIDTGIHGADKPYIYKMGGLLLMLGVLGLASSLTAQYFAAKAAVGFGTELRSALFRHINTLSHSEIDRLGSTTLVTRMTVDINAAQQGVNMLLRLFLRAPFIVVGALIMALTVSVKLTLIFLVFTPVIWAVIWVITKRTVPMYGAIQKGLDRTSMIVGENISGVRVIRAFSRQSDERARFKQSTRRLQDRQLAAGREAAVMSPLTYVFVNIAVMLLIWFGGVNVNTGSMTQGDVIALVNYMTQILLSLIRLAELIQSLTKAQTSSERIREVFAIHTTLSDRGNKPVKAVKDSPAVEFRDVTFGYSDSERSALEGISFTAGRGETVGIIGGTGCGKSTLVNLIPRFYDATGGEVLVNGVNVKKYPFPQLRGAIGIVPQKAVLFKGTVRENMQWRKKDASDSEIERALETAQAADFVHEKPEGLRHMIEQDGRNLSGGQRQRLTIARALTGDPEILILDDSASALDLATDAALRRAIAEKTCGMTVFIVSQRVSSIRNADKIIVLDDGSIAGQGTHAELMKSCRVYREICRSQLTEEEVSRGE